MSRIWESSLPLSPFFPSSISMSFLLNFLSSYQSPALLSTPSSCPYYLLPALPPLLPRYISDASLFPFGFTLHTAAEERFFTRKSHHFSALLKTFHRLPTALGIKPKRVNMEKSSLVPPAPASPGVTHWAVCLHSPDCAHPQFLLWLFPAMPLSLYPTCLLHLVNTQHSTQVQDSTPLASLQVAFPDMRTLQVR